MNVPKYRDIVIVYQCEGDEKHEIREVVDTLDEVDRYAFVDADHCTRCKHDYGDLNAVEVDRIEFE